MTLLLLLVLVPLVPVLAQDDLYTMISPEEMIDILVDLGFPAELKTSDQSTFITTKINGYNARIFFYTEQDAGYYQSYMFLSYYTMEDLSYQEKIDLANSWNEEKRFGKAFVDSDEDFGIDMSVDLDGGITMASIEASVLLYRSVVSGFTKYIGF
jgi:hypothetical protein